MWSWKGKIEIIIFTFIGLFFGINILINIYLDDNIYSFYEMISLILVLLGYMLLFIFNYRQKWIFGLIVVSVLMSLCVYRLCMAFYHIKPY
jgi:hypothetical protein